MPGFARQLMRMTSGLGTLMFRMGVKIQGRPLLKLTTTGARTGKARHTVLSWFPDPSDTETWVIVASNGGSPRHPGWAFNLAANPGRATIDLGDGPVAVSAELVTGSERKQVWNQVVDMAPGYGSYTAKTDREIPLFRLTRSA